MSKKIKGLMERELTARLKDLEAVAVISPRGINAIKTNQIRGRLHAQGVRMAVVKNNLARRATAGSKISGFEKLLDGPSAVIYGKASIATIARLLVEEKKKDETIELRGVFFDGEVYIGDKGVEQISKLPTREEALGIVVAAMLSPGRKLAGAIKGQPGKIAALIKAVEEKAKTKEAAPAAA